MFIKQVAQPSRSAPPSAAPPRPSGRFGAGSASPDRKRNILLAAEKLFALHGYDAVTIRQIAEEAQVPLALVGYHYGPKQELFHAIFAEWSYTIEQRLAALRAVSGRPRCRGALKAIICAFVEPVLRMRASAEGEYYALLVARELLLHRPETERVLVDYFDPMAHAFIDALSAALPGATRAEVAWCYQFALGALVGHISDTRVERLSNGQARANDPSAQALLLRFIEAGIKAALRPRAGGPSRSSAASPTNTRRPP